MGRAIGLSSAFWQASDKPAGLYLIPFFQTAGAALRNDYTDRACVWTGLTRILHEGFGILFMVESILTGCFRHYPLRQLPLTPGSGMMRTLNPHES